MENRQTQNNTGSPSSSTTTTTADPMTSWYSSQTLAKTRIGLLSSLIPDPSSLSSLSDSSLPALSLLNSPSVYASVSHSLSGSSTDPLCHWLYDTFLSSDPTLRLVVLSFIPLLSHLYLSLLPLSSPSRSLSGFEAVLLSLYSHEVMSRAGKPVVVTVPDLSLPSLYHTPRPTYPVGSRRPERPSVGVVSMPLEPQTAVRSTKRACVVGVALDCYFKQVSQMPFWSKLDFCRFVAEWAGLDCPCRHEFDRREMGVCENGKTGENREMGSLEIKENGKNGENGEMGVLRNGGNGEDGENGEMGILRIGENGEDGENGEMGILRIKGNEEEMGILGIGENGENGEMGSLGIRENGETGILQATENGGGKGQDGIGSGTKGGRIALPWEILQPVLRILGHCLLAPLNVPEVKEAAGVAVRAIYARASHELMPQAILASRSLIQLDKRAREAERAAMVASASSKVNTPSKAKRPEMLLVSK